MISVQEVFRQGPAVWVNDVEEERKLDGAKGELGCSTVSGGLANCMGALKLG